jgi:hypothetical protein
MTATNEAALKLALVTKEEAIRWMECALRNVDHLELCNDDIEDVRAELERFRLAAIETVTELAAAFVDDGPYLFRREYPEALRSYEHLKGSTDE